MNKAIALTHLNVTFNIASMQACWQWFRQGDTVQTVLPMYHIYGACNGVLLNILMGIPFVLLPRFVPETFLAAIDKYRVTVSMITPLRTVRAQQTAPQALPLVPPLVNFLCMSPLVDQYDLSSLRIICAGAAPVIPSSYDRVYERFARRGVHLQLATGYGLTETSTCTVCITLAQGACLDNNCPPSLAGLITYVPTFKQNQKKGSVGVLIPNSEGRIVDDADVDALPGEPGEIWLRSPAVMK